MFPCSFMHIVLHILEISMWGANKLLKQNHLLHQQAATAAGSRFRVCWQQNKSPSEVRPCGPSEQQLARQAEMLQISCNHEVVRSHSHSRWQLLSGWSRPNNDMLALNLPEHRWRRPAGWPVCLMRKSRFIHSYTCCVKLNIDFYAIWCDLFWK